MPLHPEPRTLNHSPQPQHLKPLTIIALYEIRLREAEAGKEERAREDAIRQVRGVVGSYVRLIDVCITQL